MRVVIVGAGFVGGPLGAVLATRVPDVQVWMVDNDAALIDKWRSAELPIYEPQLDELIAECRDRNLFFTTDLAEAARTADVVFVAVSTPTKSYGVGVGRASEVKNVESVARELAACFASTGSESFRVVVEKSTVPVKTADALSKIFREVSSSVVEVVSCPEFLSQGSAIHDILNPDRVLIGAQNTERGRRAMGIVSWLYEQFVPRERIITAGLFSTELAKLAANALLAQRVSSINSVSAICEALGADCQQVARAVGSDARIGSHFLVPGVGFGGSSFTKDLLSLVYLCYSLNMPEVASYWEEILTINDFQRRRFSKSVVRSLFDTLADKRIAVFGFAYKKNTSDPRDSPAIYICGDMLTEHALLSVYDPHVPGATIRGSLADVAPATANLERSVEIASDPYAACKGAHAILVLTDWDEFNDLDYESIYKSMAKPAFVFDGRDMLNTSRLQEIGFHVYTVGKFSSDPLVSVITGNVTADSQSS